MRDYVTIVSGLPRSGTSMMMQMLGAGGIPLLTDGIRQPDEDNPRGYFEFEPIKRTREDGSWVERARGGAVKVVYILLRDLPSTAHYRVILMRREIRDVMASQRAMLIRSGRPGAGVSDQRMIAIFEQELRAAEAWLSQQTNFTVTSVTYGNCLDAPLQVAAAINQFLDGGLDVENMARAVDRNHLRVSGSKALS